MFTRGNGGARRRLARVALAAALSIGGTAAIEAGVASAASAKTWYVSASATSDPACSSASSSNPFATLAGALACTAKGDTISIGAGSFPAGVTLPHSVSLTGAGAGTVLTMGAAATPLITDAPGTSVKLSKLTIDATGATANAVQASSGSLSLTGVTVENAYGVGVDVEPATGSASVTVSHSTFTHDWAAGSGAAGGVYVSSASGQPASTLTVSNSTFENDFGERAAGLASGNANATVVNSTFDSSELQGSISDGGVAGGYASGTGGVSGSLRLGNDLIDAGAATDACNDVVGKVVDLGNNVFSIPGAGGCSGIVNGSNGDQVGTTAQPLNVGLGALASNGGLTQTEALEPGSPAIGAGNASLCASAPVGGLDQRGAKRAANTRLSCDVGAYDTAGKEHVWYVSAAAKGTPTCSTASSSNPFKTIAAALACAQNGDTVKIGAGTFAGRFTVPANVVLTGAGANKTTISDPAGASPAAEVTTAGGTFVTLAGLTINGEIDSATGAGNGGVLENGASLILDRVAVVNACGVNFAGNAPISEQPSTGNAILDVFDSTLSGNVGTQSGGIFVTTATGSGTPSIVNVVNSTLSGNTGAGNAGAINLADGAATLRDDTIAGNTGNATGGIFLSASSNATVTNSIIANNVGFNAPSDCEGNPVTDGGHNVIGVASPGAGQDCGFVNGSNGDEVGSASSPLNPDLGPLANNGGTTQTMALQPGSPAIGAGSAADCEAFPVSNLDQRGVSRNAKTRGACDVGAYDTGGVA